MLDNLSDAYDVDYLDQELQIAGNYAGEGSTVFFKGVVQEVEPVYGLDGRLDTLLRCTSFFRTLERKPVNTEFFDSEDGSDLMTRIAEEYGAVHTDFVNITEDGGTTFEDIIISENSVVDALRKLAQACGVEIFVSGGVLVTAAFKAAGDAVDYVLDPADTVEVLAAHSVFEGASCVNVRGRSTWEKDVTPIEIFNDVVEWNSPYNVMDATFFIPLEQTYDIYSLATATVTSNYGTVTSSGEASPYGDWMFVTIHHVDGVNNVPITVTVTIKPVKQKEKSGRNWKENVKPVQVNKYGFPTYGSWRGINMMPRVRAHTVLYHPYHSDEGVEDRINVVRCNATLEALVGYRYVEVDNPYIFSEANAEAVGDRVLQEILQGMNKWQIKAPWNHNIGINSKITFTKLGTGTTKDGVVIAEDTSWSAESGGVDAVYTAEEL